MSFLNMPLKFSLSSPDQKLQPFLRFHNFAFTSAFFPLLISAGILRHLAVEKEVTRAEAYQTWFTKYLISPLLLNYFFNFYLWL